MGVDTVHAPGEIRRHLGFWAASASLVLVLIGSGAVAILFPRVPPTTRVWMVLPLLAGAAGMLASAKGQAGPLWGCAGAIFGFAVLGAWSIGAAYVPAAWTMLAAAVVQPADQTESIGWRTLRAVLWTLAGASVLGVFSLAMDWWNTSVVDYSWSDATGFGHVHESHTVAHAPVTVWAAWLFAAVWIALAVGYWVAYQRRHRR